MMSSILKMLTFLLLVILLAGKAICQVENQSGQIFSAALLRQDFNMLKDSLKKVHAGIYRYSSRQEIEKIFDSCAATIRDRMSLPQFFTLTQFALASLKDGHTNCRLPQQAMKEYLEKVKVFPAMVLFIHQRAYIYCCKQSNALTESEIISINGQPMSKILDRMYTYLCSDGGIQSRKNWEMPENFHLLFNTLYGIRENYTVQYKSKEGEILSATLTADYVKNIFCDNPFPRPAKYLQLSYAGDHTAVLTLKSFFNGFLDQTGEQFSQFLDSAFSDINRKKIRRLLLDLRSNQGGNDDNGILLYSHLTGQPFAYYAAKETAVHQFSERDDSGLGINHPATSRFNGKAYLLLNGRSFSGVAEFASVFRSNRRGLILGEECGGGYYGNTSGSDITLVLPNTGIQVRVPLVKYTMAVKKQAAGKYGTMPDYPIDISIRDIVEKQDGQLTAALKILSVDQNAKGKY